MKLKARDIIAGWPKPRSTAVMPAWRSLVSGNCILFDEVLATINYHEAQQRMVDHYFAQYRLPPPDRLEKMRWALFPGRRA